MKLEGKIAVITAAGRRIGRAIALKLAQEGATIVANSFRDETTQAVVDEIVQQGGKAVGVAGDAASAPVVKQVIEKTIETYGKIDILINNVGGVNLDPTKDTKDPLGMVEALWDWTYAMSLKGPALMTAAVVPHFKKQKSGKIINMASIAGRPDMAFTTIPPIPACYNCPSS